VFLLILLGLAGAGLYCLADAEAGKNGGESDAASFESEAAPVAGSDVSR